LGQMSSSVVNASSASLNATSVLRLHSLSADMAVVGRHVIGDVIAQVDAQSDVSLQLQWTTRIGDAPPYDVPIVGQCDNAAVHIYKCSSCLKNSF